MTKRVNGKIIFEEEPPQTCELCGSFEECRPYGPNGEQICYACGMKDEETTRRTFRKKIMEDG